MKGLGSALRNAISKVKKSRSRSQEPAATAVPQETAPSAAPEPDLSAIVAQVDFANELQASGKEDEAQAQYDAALEAYQRLAGKEDPHVLILEFTQAQTMLRRGELQAAKAKLIDLCERSARVSGAHNASTLAFADSLAATLMRLGEFDQARSLLTPLLETRLKWFSPQDVDATLSTASVLVTHYLNSDNWAGAVPVQEQIVALLRRLRGELNPESLLALSLLSVMYVEAGELAKARVLLQVASGAHAIVFGREHAETLRMFLLLGLVLERQHDPMGARAVLERSYAIALREHGEEHELSLRFGTKLGGVLLNLKEYGEAKRVLMDVLPVCERVTGKSSVTTLTNLNNLAVAIWEQGQHGLGYSVAKEVFERNSDAFGAGHQRTVQAEQQLKRMQEGLENPQPEPQEDTVMGVQMEGTVNFGESSILLRLRGFQMPHSKQ